MKKRKKEKFQFSKIIVIVSCVIFMACLYKGFTTDFTTITDVSFYVTSVTISGGVFSSTIIWYLKKSQSENNVKLKIEMYKVSSKERLKYNEEMMILKKKYEISDEQLMELENNSPMVDFEQDALSSINALINMAENEAESFVEMQNY